MTDSKPINNKLTELVSSLFTVRQQKSALEKVEKSILDELKPMVDPQFDEKGIACHAGDLVLSRTTGTSRTISGDLLLERGVAPDIIADATKTTTYFQYKVKEQGENK